jgi:methionyl-tRNA formyltransferase
MIGRTSMNAERNDERDDKLSTSRRGSDPLHIMLIGMGTTTLTALEGLTARDAIDVVALVRTGVDATTERAAELGVAVIDDARLASVRSAVAELRPDAVVVSSYNRILDAELISACPFVNVHYAPLPRGRGRATVNWALINGDTHAAISIHHLVAGLDAGGILYQELVEITPDATVTTLYESLNELQRENIAAAVLAAIDGDEGRLQIETEATSLCTRTPADGDIDWTLSTAAIDRLVRALQDPFPSAYTWLGLEQLHISEAHVPSHAPTYEGRIPGRVVFVNREEGSVDVLSGDGVVRLARVRLGDGPMVDAATVITSVSMTLGLQTIDLVRALRSQR